MGDRESHLAHAIRGLGAAGRLIGLSSVYETDPVGLIDQPPFLNMVVRLRTALAPEGLLAAALALEAARGRERSVRDAPRTLDVDLLLYGDRIVETGNLTIPHARMRARAFVLVPLLELDPALVDPVTGESFGAMLRDASGVRRLYPGDRLLEE